MALFIQIFWLSLPLFLTIGAGFLSAKTGLLNATVGSALTRFSFTVAIPCLLFQTISGLSVLDVPDSKVIFSYFGGCLVVFVVSRLIAEKCFKASYDKSTIFGMSAIFSNNVQLGIPIALELLGKESFAAIALIVSLNVFLLWLASTVLIEFGRSRGVSLGNTLIQGCKKTLLNPVIIAILLGLACNFADIQLGTPITSTVNSLAATAAPIALFSLGIGLAQYRITHGQKETAAAAVLKLFAQPAAVFALCLLLDVGIVETRAACLLSSLPTGVNVYIMSREFKAGETQAANTLLVTTLLSSITVPFLMHVMGIL